MHKALVSLSVAIAATVMGAPAGAATPAAPPARQNAPWAGGHGQRHHAMGVLRQLDLSQAQRASIRGYAKDGFQQARPEMAALRAKRAAFANAVPGTAAYQAAANDLAHAEANAALARTLRQSDLRSKIYQILTPAQRTQLATLQAQRRERQEWRRSHRQPAASDATAS